MPILVQSCVLCRYEHHFHTHTPVGDVTVFSSGPLDVSFRELDMTADEADALADALKQGAAFIRARTPKPSAE